MSLMRSDLRVFVSLKTFTHTHFSFKSTPLPFLNSRYASLHYTSFDSFGAFQISSRWHTPVTLIALLHILLFCFPLFTFITGLFTALVVSCACVTMGDPLVVQLEKDFRAIEQSDPSLADGFRVVYDREIPCEMRAAENSGDGSLEGIRVKVLTLGDSQSLVALRVEVTSECDLFFHQTCVINHVGFLRLREHQSLVCDFADFLMTFLKMLNRCIKEPQRFLMVFIVGADGASKMEFVENLEYKLINVLSLPFRASTEVVVKEQISYRYSALRARLAILTTQLKTTNIACNKLH
uniref:Uncharacterized protein TCIL3000_10_6790 n=1 Tax=Trypanosoma congolense (strain IL3000) TaxID=1068625 RepID=G0UWY9_TRYCI|nr:unnamed protein product [Trypanosoma congolense IL3000]